MPASDDYGSRAESYIIENSLAIIRHTSWNLIPGLLHTLNIHNNGGTIFRSSMSRQRDIILIIPRARILRDRSRFFALQGAFTTVRQLFRYISVIILFNGFQVLSHSWNISTFISVYIGLSFFWSSVYFGRLSSVLCSYASRIWTSRLVSGNYIKASFIITPGISDCIRTVEEEESAKIVEPIISEVRDHLSKYLNCQFKSHVLITLSWPVWRVCMVSWSTFLGRQDEMATEESTVGANVDNLNIIFWWEDGKVW